MADSNNDPSTASDTHIRIVGLNTDKTRRAHESRTEYQVYFELSGGPPGAWREIFGREWKKVNSKQEAEIDGDFLCIQCPLEEIAATYLPALKKVVQTTNVAYEQFARDQVTKDEHLADVWEEERKVVEDLAKSLRYE